MTSMETSARADARAAVDFACRLYGKARGWFIAAQQLGVAERTARGLSYGETTGATIDPDTAFHARMAFRRARAEQIRAELRALENDECEQLGRVSVMASGGLGIAAGTARNGARATPSAA